MKIEVKHEGSGRSDSDADDNTRSPPQNVNSGKNKKNKTFSAQTAILPSTSVSDSSDSDEEPVSTDSEGKFSCEKIPQKTNKQNFRENSIKEIPVKSIFNIDDLTSDDEIYMFQCPENYAKQDLCNKTIDLTKSNQLSFDGEVYKLEVLNSEKKFITLAVPGKNNHGSLVKLPFKGHIIIQKDINMSPSKPKDEDFSGSQKIAFPNDIKIRHPLLGAEWKSYIDLANEAINKSKSKKKKKKIKEKFEEIMEVDRRKLKRKHSESEIFFHKKKKKKHES